LPRPKQFINKHVISFAVEQDVYEKFRAKCFELGVTPSEVLREFVCQFCMAKAAEVKKTITFNISLNLTKVEKIDNNESCSKAQQLVREEMLNELKVAIASARRVLADEGFTNTMALLDRKKHILKLLRKLRDVPEDVLAQAQCVINEINERVYGCRRG